MPSSGVPPPAQAGAPRSRAGLVGIVVLVGLLSGSLGGQADPGDVVNFAEIASRYFHSFHVVRETGAPTGGYLILHVRPVGDAERPDLTDAKEWLRQNLRIVVLERADGMPVYFTEHDLVGSRGNDALGATIPSGIAIESRNPRLLGCTFAHEVGHAMGLGHDAHDRNALMAPRCGYDKLDYATVTPAERARVDSVHAITAYGLGGASTWAFRLPPGVEPPR